MTWPAVRERRGVFLAATFDTRIARPRLGAHLAEQVPTIEERTS